VNRYGTTKPKRWLAGRTEGGRQRQESDGQVQAPRYKTQDVNKMTSKRKPAKRKPSRRVKGKFARTIKWIDGKEFFHLKSYYSKRDADKKARAERNRCPKCSARVIKSTQRLRIWDDDKHKYVYKWHYHVYINLAAGKFHI